MLMHAGGVVHGKAAVSNDMVIPKILRNRIASRSKIPLLCLYIHKISESRDPEIYMPALFTVSTE